MSTEFSQNNKSVDRDTQKHLENSRSSFQVPDGYFDSKCTLLESAMKRDFEVPADYFDGHAKELEVKLHSKSVTTRYRSIRMWVTVAAAALMAGVIYWLKMNEKETPTFSEQLEQTELEFEDLEELEFEADMFEEFIILDTLTPDTAIGKQIQISIHDFKPSKGQSVINWDELDATDIEEYLKDEESFEIIDEL
jgi:hypothetical protein